ncbi:MAG: hypothetical protein JWM92_94 [Candidatus Nomurabacteria bacterium]|jgi:hypothetical protein|nr:hypothetical protein [Candidatus Nomurabacteria bacterium]
MSQHQYITTLERQIKVLNERIDAKIMSGQRYVEESQRHRALLRKLREQRRGNGLFGRFSLFA